MTTRAALVERLSGVPATELLDFLTDDAIINLAARYFQRTSESQARDIESLPAIDTAAHLASTDSTTVEPTPEANFSDPAKEKAKRPLNGFMAFRSYYLKIFSGVPQKSASGFLTMLWHKDPFRNRWALIAKVYSFIRDEIGKDKVPLSQFLGLCCPLMNIIEPSNYLSALGWNVENDDSGSQQLLRHDNVTDLDGVALESQDLPTTEFDLLSSILDIGVIPAKSLELIQRLNVHNNGRMVSDPSRRPVPCTIEKLDFLCTAQEDPIKATRMLFGQHYDEEVMQQSGYQLHEVEDLGRVGHLPLQPPMKGYDPYAQLGLEQPIFDPDAVPEHECYDVGNPYDMDNILGFPQVGVEGGAAFPPAPPFSAQEDFQLMF